MKSSAVISEVAVGVGSGGSGVKVAVDGGGVKVAVGGGGVKVAVAGMGVNVSVGTGTGVSVAAVFGATGVSGTDPLQADNIKLPNSKTNTARILVACRFSRCRDRGRLTTMGGNPG